MSAVTVDLAVDYLKDRHGSVEDFITQISRYERLGQAFFNALSPEDQKRLIGRDEDPFHDDNRLASETILRAIDFLLVTE